MSPYITVILVTFGTSIGTAEAPARSRMHCWAMLGKAVYQQRLDAMFDPSRQIRFAMCKARKGLEI